MRGAERESPATLNSLVHSIHHKAALLRQRNSEFVELNNQSIRLAITYSDPQYLGISIDSNGIPRSFTSNFITYILSQLVPYKDFLYGIKKCTNAWTLFKRHSSFHPELFHSILPDISQASGKAHVKDALSLVLLSRGIQTFNISIFKEIREKISPKKLIIHVYGYKPSAGAENFLRSFADYYKTLHDEDFSSSIGHRFLYRRHKTTSVKILVPDIGKGVIFAHLTEYDMVMGMIVSRDYLFSEIYSYHSRDSFLILFEKSGRLLYQPSNEDLNSNSYFINLVSKRIFKEYKGNIQVSSFQFMWRRVDTTPFIVLLVKRPMKSVEKQAELNTNDVYTNSFNNITLEFHNKLDTKLCRHFRSPANTDIGSLYFSPLVFKDPLNRPETPDFMAYLNNISNHNPGLRNGIKQEVLLLTQVTPFWKAKTFDSGLNNYIVRRYVATLSGILYVYPGIRFSNIDMDPRMQEWFLKASKFPDKVILSSPSLDPGGAGFIVTLSRAISHPRYHEASTIVAMDLTLGYVYKMLINTFPICKETSYIRCFIFDHEGYVIAHPKLIKVHTKDNKKKYHITHLEPQIINDLLTFENFVRKTICKSRSDDTVIQKRYEFNHSYPSPIVSLNRKRCNPFEISPIPESNLFLGLVNSSNCDEKSSINFCPCDVEGDRCILCGPLELMECECPCTCTDPCFFHENESLPACENEPQSLNPIPVDLDYLSDLPECLTTDCGSRTIEEDCLGLLGCSWCREKLISSYEPANWVTMNTDSFCGTLDECFNGRLGELSPYQVIDSEGQQYFSQDAFDEFRSSPIGPVAGGIMGFFIFLSVTVYCYRVYVNSSSSSASLNSNSDQATRRLFDHASIKTTDDEEEKRRPNYSNVNLSSIEIPPNAIISPYRMNPEYRRPPPGTDSDHGYSTMTPFGDIDSDIAGVSIAHCNRLRGLQYHSSMGSSSIASSPSLVNNKYENLLQPTDESSHPQDKSLTVLGANQFIVAATVHMVDTQ
ncbi:unnamed protein product [Lepeophtheirus salmonis]|nr:unnamed protein product [Lepeophtheirus salmonis]CAF2889934.1 unnamed protein product [Lepeophtheirus salmonis]